MTSKWLLSLSGHIALVYRYFELCNLQNDMQWWDRLDPTSTTTANLECGWKTIRHLSPAQPIRNDTQTTMAGVVKLYQMLNKQFLPAIGERVVAGPGAV